jgi:catechol 2,3-dioxygenase-like lactoylglutathione lyase family enzyme
VRFVNPIAFVADIAAATAFYRDVVGLRVEKDFGSFVLFEGHFGLHDGNALIRTIWGADAPAGEEPYGRRNLLLYFEDDDIEQAFERMRGSVNLIHPLVKQPWGQRVFRFLDPDGHAVEIGEPLA